eukprot:750763-Karenia_brevis.AAC.1
MTLFNAGAEGLEAQEVARLRKTASAAAQPLTHAAAVVAELAPLKLDQRAAVAPTSSTKPMVQAFAAEPAPAALECSTTAKSAGWRRRVRRKTSLDALRRGNLQMGSAAGSSIRTVSQGSAARIGVMEPEDPALEVFEGVAPLRPPAEHTSVETDADARRKFATADMNESDTMWRNFSLLVPACDDAFLRSQMQSFFSRRSSSALCVGDGDVARLRSNIGSLSSLTRVLQLWWNKGSVYNFDSTLSAKFERITVDFCEQVLRSVNNREPQRLGFGPCE